MRLAVGRVARAHGVRGRLLIAPYNEESTALTAVRRLYIEGREFEVARAERVNLGYLVAVRGIDDRDAADALRGKEVEVERDELPDAAEDEMYAIDLIGFEVVDDKGKVHGVVEDLEEAGPQDLLKLKGGALVPLGLVKEVVSEARRIVIEVPEGLFELEE
ncbi:MAG: ribosome maturation factor RimM [Myxococcales bacterium]